MHADYVPNPLYDNNPFIEALPPMLSGKDLIRALAVIPPYSDSDRDRSTGERLQLLSSLYEFYQPLSMTIDLYCEIYTAMQHCYGQYPERSRRFSERLRTDARQRPCCIHRRWQFFFCHWRIRTWQVHRIATRIIIVPAGYRTHFVSRAKFLLPSDSVSSRANPARCVH